MAMNLGAMGPGALDGVGGNNRQQFMNRLGGAGQGALAGGAGGFMLGGPPGAALGALGGGLMGGLMPDTPASYEQIQQFTPEQQQAFSSALQQALAGLGQNQLDFGPIAQQARTNFSQQTVPGIAERFSSMGGQRSSAFGQQLGAAGAGLESNLAGQQAQYGLQANQLLQNLLGIGLTPQFDTLRNAPQEGFGSSIMKFLPMFSGGM